MTATRITSPAAYFGRMVRLNASALTNAWESVVENTRDRRDRDQLRPGPGQPLDGMTPDECWNQLAAGTIGRVAFTAHSGTPVIVPVNYAVDAETVVFRSGRGPKLMAATRGDLVAFEVDDIDTQARTGWSVVVTGTARLARTADERAHLGSLDLQSWAGGPRDEFVVIEPRHVAGRRLLPTSSPTG